MATVTTGTKRARVGKAWGEKEGQEATPKTERVGLPLCWDGCGTQTSGKNRRFLSGHDARLASLLQRVSDGEVAPDTLPALVRFRLDTGEIALPAAKRQTVTVTVTATVTVATGDDALAQAKDLIARKLGGQQVTVTDVALAQPETVTVTVTDEAPAQA